MSANSVRLRLRANARQFALLVGLNALVGALVGLERSVLPLVGESEFGISSKTALLAFVAAFGAAKAVANLVAGRLADTAGRKRLLVAGWILALPAAALVAVAPGWGWILVANIFLGASQGLSWSLTVFMKIDLAGPRQRGLALGLNESAGYVGLAVTAFATGALAASVAPRTLFWTALAALALVGLTASVLFVRDTAAHVRVDAGEGSRSIRDRRVVRACAQAGFVNNLNDALAWGLAPLYLAAAGATIAEIGIVAAVYPAVWGFGQLAAGWASDRTGRKPLIVLGMAVQALALVILVAGSGEFTPALVAAVLLGVGTALAYPTLIAAVSDAVPATERARAVGAYRFWRDAGLVGGALAAGFLADTLGTGWAIGIVAGATAASGAWVALTAWPVPSADAVHPPKRWMPSEVRSGQADSSGVPSAR